MRTDIVFTLTGPDRVGIVEEVTSVVLRLGGNVETSRMARLGGEFAILMQVSLAADKIVGIDAAFAGLASRGYKMTAAEAAPAPARPDWSSYRVQVAGADHEGIVHEVASVLSSYGINIESAETSTSSAPVSGATLFHLDAIVSVPPSVGETDWISAVADAGDRSGVDVTVASED